LATSVRVEDLMSRMSLREKIAQLYGLWLGIDESGQVAPHQQDFAAAPRSGDWEGVVSYGVGQLTRPYGTAPVSPVAGAEQVAKLQRQIVGAGRFGIPAMVHEECLTGLTAWQATIYPSPLCWGASFDPDLVERMGAQIGQTMRRLGVHQGLAPVLDVARDMRWGRIEETIGEDPYLVGTIGSAYVRGLESAGIVSTLKHFVGYSSSRAGRNLAPVSMGWRELADVMLPPFEMALRAGARSVMNSYTNVDGLPVAANEVLLTDVLRGKFGFSGTVVSDYFSVAFLQTLHGVAGSSGEAAALALKAGIDVELPAVNCFGEDLLEAVESGRVDAGLIDRATRRVLSQKDEAGLLDPDWSSDPPLLFEEDTELDGPQCRSLARELARRSIVLLANDGTLPLKAGTRVAVIGPRASEASAMLGCYSFPMHVGARHPGTALGVAIPHVLEVLRGDPAAYQVTYAQGCPVLGGDEREIAAAARTAAAADVCLALLGDEAGLFGAGTSGEGCDAVDLRLPGRQEELLEAVLATGTPVVLVLLVGRPYDISRQASRLAAALCGFFLGEEGAPALSDVLSGRTNPSGHLPVSFPSAGGSQPSTYLAPPLGRRSEVSNIDPTPIFAFGHGLSYAPPTWVKIEALSARQWATDGVARVSVTLHNTADRPTAELVQVYLHDPVAEVSRPVQQLIAAQRVELEVGATRTVMFEMHADLTSYTGRAGHRQVDAGEVELQVGPSSVDIRRSLSFELVGPARQVGPDRELWPTIEVGP
jgi:beta-glucosidase